MWEALAAGDNMTVLRDQLPDEFLADFDAIISVLQKQVDMKMAIIKSEAHRTRDLSDKELGLMIQRKSVDPGAEKFLFHYRKNGGGQFTGLTRDAFYRSLRPTGNHLPGYTPSYAMHRLIEEAA